MSKVDFKAIKAGVDLQQWAQANLEGYKPGNPGMALCPAHNEKTPSLAVYRDHAFCHGACKKAFDIIDLLEVQGMARPQAIEHAAQLAGVAIDAPAQPTGKPRPARPGPTRPPTRPGPPARPATHPPGPDPDPTHLPGYPDPLPTRPGPGLDLEALVTAAVAAWPAGGLEQYRNLEGVAGPLRFGVVTAQVAQTIPGAARYGGRLLIPSLDAQGRVLGITARALEGQEPKYQRPAGQKTQPYNGPAAVAIAERLGWILLTEGELDAAAALAALGLDQPVMGLPGGNLPDEWADKLANIKGLEVCVLMDDDDAGRGHAERLANKLEGRCKLYTLAWTGEDPGADVRELLDALGPAGLADWLGDRISRAQIPPMDTAYMSVQFLEELATRWENPPHVYTSTLASLDALLEGGYGEGLHILGGIAGGGKTMLALQIARENAAQGRPVLFVTYEQSKFELWYRLAARESGLPLGAFKRGRYVDGSRTIPTFELLRNNTEALNRLELLGECLWIVQGDGDNAWGASRLATEAARIADALGQPPLVIVDYLHRMPAADSESARREIRERVAMLASALQVKVARANKCPVLALSSVNRAAYNAGRNVERGRVVGGDSESLLSAFKEAGEVEYSAYTAALLYRLSDEEAQLTGQVVASRMGGWDPFALHLVKNREGETAKVYLKRFGKAGRLEDGGLARD